MYISAMKRKEIKFIISSKQKDSFEKMIKDNMVYDKHCENGKPYLVRNLYYDTINNDFIRKSVQKPKFKEKLRVRKYGDFNDGVDCCYIELKRKFDGIVYKRRISSKLSSILKNQNIKNYCIVDKDLQKKEEIAYFLDNNEIIPKTFLYYYRLGYTGIEDPSLRITFDSNICYRTNNYNFDDQSFDGKIIEDNNYVLEIKVNGSIPLWLARCLSKNQIYHHSFSKIGNAYKKELSC